MLRGVTPSLCACIRRVWAGPLYGGRPCSTLPPGGVENQLTVDALYELSVDIRKVRKLKGWVLLQPTAYVRETAGLLRELGADGPAIARVLEQHPRPSCAGPRSHRASQEANVRYFQSLQLNKRIISKLLASAPRASAGPWSATRRRCAP
ncbi:hypothetical protein ANANG_G00314920 [Anguilla anguilla]|uniref:Uncharacterized protein n=1 Tax=Anguilla anguilla TaxID=7936 RepID=A0A9D3RHX3_ANGAN|nr:hypothetical protein ANANG_G00314920 [Anguilla anguilla]